MNEKQIKRYNELWEQRNALNKELATLMCEDAQMDVEDYELKDHWGKTVLLSEAFGKHDKLVLVHNMGNHCNYCTLWAEGFKGIWRHLGSGEYGNSTAFLLVNNDNPETQRNVAAKHGWDFPMLSAKGTTLFADLGFQTDEDGKSYYNPGVSTLMKDESGRIHRNAKESFGPGDMFCSVFHFFDLFPRDRKE